MPEREPESNIEIVWADWVDDRGQVFIVFTLRDGLIVEIQDYLARRDALAAAGASDPSGWR